MCSLPWRWWSNEVGLLWSHSKLVQRRNQYHVEHCGMPEGAHWQVRHCTVQYSRPGFAGMSPAPTLHELNFCTQNIINWSISPDPWELQFYKTVSCISLWNFTQASHSLVMLCVLQLKERHSIAWLLFSWPHQSGSVRFLEFHFLS